MGRVEGKVAIVTGAASGIGRAAAERLAGEGASVCVSDVDAAAGKAVVDGIKQEGGKAIFVKADVSKERDAERLVNATVKALGASRFDLKYSAGALRHELMLGSIELYGRQVMPLVRSLIAEPGPHQ